MNHYNFLQTGGFPMDVNVLDRMQTSYRLFNGLGELAGDLAIIKGCTISGTAVSAGVVYIGGEVLEFRAGELATDVIIMEEILTAEFQDGAVNDVHYTRYATFGVGTTSYPWANFKRVFPTTQIQAALDLKEDKTAVQALLLRVTELEKKNAVFQADGGMVLWNKPAAQIPPGWQEVVNWRGRMPVGFDSTQTEFNLQGKQDGAKSKTLSINEIPAHNHGVIAYAGIQGTNYGQHISASVNGASFDRTGSAGGGQSFSIMNPYRVVMFIEYIG